MENKREHSTNHAIPKTPKEIIVNSLTELFADDEFGFDMFIMLKTGEPDRKSTRLNSSHSRASRMPSAA